MLGSIIVNDIGNTTEVFAKDIFFGHHSITFISDIGEENKLVLTHDSVNMIRAMYMHAVDYPNSFLYHYEGQKIDGMSLLLPAVMYDYLFHEANQHITVPDPLITITTGFKTKHVEMLIQNLTFPIQQYIIDEPAGLFVQPWYDYYKGKTMVKATMIQTMGDRKIDRFCEKLCKVLPYQISSPYNVKLYQMIHPSKGV